MKSRQYFVSLELQRKVNVECYHFANKSTPLNINLPHPQYCVQYNTTSWTLYHSSQRDMMFTTSSLPPLAPRMQL